MFEHRSFVNGVVLYPVWYSATDKTYC